MIQKYHGSWLHTSLIYTQILNFIAVQEQCFLNTNSKFKIKTWPAVVYDFWSLPYRYIVVHDSRVFSKAGLVETKESKNYLYDNKN